MSRSWHQTPSTKFKMSGVETPKSECWAYYGGRNPNSPWVSKVELTTPRAGWWAYFGGQMLSLLRGLNTELTSGAGCRAYFGGWMSSLLRGPDVELTSRAECRALSHTSLFSNSKSVRIIDLTDLTIVISVEISLAWPLILERNHVPRLSETRISWFIEADFCSGFCWAHNFQSCVSVDHWFESLDLDHRSGCTQLPLFANLAMLLTFLLLFQLSVPPAEVNHDYDFCNLRSEGWTHLRSDTFFQGLGLGLTNCIVALYMTVLPRSETLPVVALHQLTMPLTICWSQVLSIIPVSNFALIQLAIQACNKTIFKLNQFSVILNQPNTHSQSASFCILIYSFSSYLLHSKPTHTIIWKPCFSSFCIMFGQGELIIFYLWSLLTSYQGSAWLLTSMIFDIIDWHQWQLQLYPAISPFVIDGNIHTFFLALAPPIIMLYFFSLPLSYQWQRERLLMLSCFVFWGGNYSQFLSKILKGLPWERLSEDVCNLLFCLNIFQFDVVFCDLFS